MPGWLIVAATLLYVNTWRPRQDGRHFPEDIFICIFLNENVSILIKISLNFISNGPINNIPALVQIMAWCQAGDKSLSEPIMVNLLMHICDTRPQWISTLKPEKMANIMQMTFWNVFLWWEIFCILPYLDSNFTWKFTPKGLFNDRPSWVQEMAWCWTGDQMLPELLIT